VKPVLLPLLVALLGLSLVACGERDQADDGAVGPQHDLTGTWEVVEDSDLPLARGGQRYTFAEDSTLQIYRPPALGVTTAPILAVYDLRGDTLLIRSEYDAEMLLVGLQVDTLTLTPVGSGLTRTLVRVENAGAIEAAPSARTPDTTVTYSPPADVPPEDLPRN
jgi:hypothetical protein